MNLSSEARTIIGLILITVPTIEFGGVYLLSLLRKWRGETPTQEQRAYFRAGHAHAGVLVILAIVAQLLIDVANLTPSLAWALRAGFFLPPILISAGFFGGAPRQEGKPGALISLIFIGAILLAISALGLGAALAFNLGAA